jgi:hypothetical protein
MVGRASRPLEDKTEYLLFDFVDNYWEHGLPNREHDWRSHFVGLTRREKKERGQDTEERQFEIEAETGEVFISTLAKLPDGFKGQILQEVEPLNTKFAEALRKRQAKLDEINRKKREKEEAIQRKKEEIERRKQERLDEIQRIKDAKLAEIQRKKDAKEAAIQKKIAEKEAAIQRYIAAKAAKIQQKLDEKAAKLQKIEDARLAKIREQEEREESWVRSRLISKIQDAANTRRAFETREFYRIQEEAQKKRREESTEMYEKLRAHNYTNWDAYYQQREDHRQQEKTEIRDRKQHALLQRMEIQFEIGLRMYHSIHQGLLRLFKHCFQKRHETPHFSLVEQFVAPYLTGESLFTQEDFDNAVTMLESRNHIKIDR